MTALERSYLYALKYGYTVFVFSAGHSPLARLPFSGVFTDISGIMDDPVDSDVEIQGHKLSGCTLGRDPQAKSTSVLLAPDGSVLGCESPLLDDPKGADLFTTGKWPSSPVKSGNRLKTILPQLTLSQSLSRSVGRAVANSAPPGGFGNVAGIHYRNTDRDEDFEAVAARALRMTGEKGLRSAILCTDDAGALAQFQAVLGPQGVSVAASGNLPTPSEPNRHRNLHYAKFDSPAARVGMLVATLADLYILSTVGTFVPSSTPTGWNYLIPQFREDKRLRAKFFGFTAPDGCGTIQRS